LDVSFSINDAGWTPPPLLPVEFLAGIDEWWWWWVERPKNGTTPL
jgi:hypothetical protein